MAITFNLSSWFARAGSVLAAGLVLMALASPAEARRKSSFGSTGSKSTSAPKAPPATSSGMSKVMLAALMTRAALKVTAKRLTKVHELPESERTKLPDGRYVHIGELSGMLYGKSYVGWVSSTEYLKLSTAELSQLLLIAGFYSVQEFEEHLATAPPPAQDTAATVATAEVAAPAEPTGLSGMAIAALAGLVALLAGFVGYCVLAARGKRDDEKPSSIPARASSRAVRPAVALSPVTAARPSMATRAAPGRPPRAAQVSAPVAVKPPLVQAAGSATLPRRAPRDLGALTRRTQPA